MGLHSTIKRLDRRIRVAVIGGGDGALIGGVHRTALRFDDHFDIVASVLSRNAEQSLQQGIALGVLRPYACLRDLLAAESERDDGVDVVVVTTPKDSHFEYCRDALRAGFHVICDKPVANTFTEGRALLDEARTNRRHLFVTYNTTGYPMVRQARAMMERGEIGVPHLVEVHYAQGNLGSLVEKSSVPLDRQLAWRLDPNSGGEHHVLLDVGVHVQNLATYVTSREFTRVFADAGVAVKGRSFVDSATIVGRLETDIRATLTITKAATGAPQVFGISVYGDKAGLNWEQSRPNELHVMRQGRPLETYTRGVADLHPLTRRSLRTPAAHPEGYREGFANIYADFAELIATSIAGDRPNPLALTCPTIEQGLRSLAFVEACVESSNQQAWVELKTA
jgi:predicted dehydrogenase